MSSRVPEPAWRLTKRQPPCASACTFSGTGVPGRSIQPCRRQWLPISLCVPGCSSGRSARRKTGEACASRGTWKPATVQRPSSRLRSASSLPAKRRLRCSACCASASATSRGRPRSWLANRSSTCSAGSSASAKTRASSLRSASTCGVSLVRAWRSAHSSLCANGVSRACRPLAHSTSAVPSTVSHCLSAPHICRYDCPCACAARLMEPCRCNAESRSNKGFSISAPCWPRSSKV